MSPPDRLPVDPPPRFWLGFLFYGDDMTSEHMQALRAEVLLPTYAGMTDAEVAASLNAVVVTARRLVPVEDVEYWATQQMTGNLPRPLLAVLEAARTDPLNPFYDLAVVILRAVAPGRKPWDMDAPGNLGLMVAAEAAGLLTTGQIASLRALAEYPTSRAAQLGLDRVREGHVKEARND